MKKILAAALLAASVGVSHADEFAFAHEGSGAKRAHLDKLQGSPPPELRLTEWVNSSGYTLEQLKGKVVVLDFWATWCGPCIAAIPKTNELMAKYDGKVVIIGVCHPRGGEKMKAMAKEKGIKYPVALDADGKTIAAYAVNSFPDYYIIDQSGKLVVADCANDKVEDVIKKLLQK